MGFSYIIIFIQVQVGTLLGFFNRSDGTRELFFPLIQDISNEIQINRLRHN